MSNAPAVYHALLRPCVLQILRVTGYYSSRTAVLDTMTDLAGRYLATLCQKMAGHAADNGSEDEPTIVHLRMALQDLGALLPEMVPEAQEYLGEEDTRGVEDFISWFASPRSKAIMDLSAGDGDRDTDATDYLSALKKKHSKTEEDSKYHATILGKGNEQGDVFVEGGGELTSIAGWAEKTRGPSPRPASSRESSRPLSSGLSSVGSRLDDDMDLS